VFPKSMPMIDMRKLLRLFLFVFLTCPLVVWPLPAAAEDLVVPGSGTPERLVRELAKAFNAAQSVHKVSVPVSSGSVGALLAIETEGRALARYGRPLNEAETGRGLRQALFARDAVVFAVGRAVRLNGLSSAQLADIYSGKYTQWRELGDSPGPIRVLARPPGESSLAIIQRQIKPFDTLLVTAGARVMPSDPVMLNMLDTLPTSIGFAARSNLFDASTAVKPLALDGIMPTQENLANGKYPLVNTYALIYKESQLNAAARQFIEFVFSDAAHKILWANGALPLERK